MIKRVSNSRNGSLALTLGRSQGRLGLLRGLFGLVERPHSIGWETLYSPPFPSDELRIRAASQNAQALDGWFLVSQYVLINLRNSEVKPLPLGPLSYEAGWPAFPSAAWSSDGKSIVLSNTFLKRDPLDANPAPRRPCQVVFELRNDSATCLEGLQVWFKRSPEFNMDKVMTPLMVVAVGRAGIVFEWEPYSTLLHLDKPVELIVLKEGTHPLTNPAQRMVSQQGTVDWMRFWLKNEEDADPAKAEQYIRWRELRKLQEQNQSKAPTN